MPRKKSFSSDEVQTSLPSIQELTSEISALQNVDTEAEEERFLSNFRDRSINSEKDYIHLRGLVDHYEHKGRWSYFLMGLMFVMIGFQSLLLYKVGVGAWSFKDYQWLLPALLVQNLAQVVGLAHFVVKSLFKDIITK